MSTGLMTTDRPMSFLTSALIDACEKQDIHAIKELIRRGVDPNAPSVNGQFPLLFAAWKGDIPTIKTLIQLGAYPYITDYCGRNALHYATIQCNLHAIRYLIIQLQIDPDHHDIWGFTPLAIATTKCDLNTIKTLIQLNANPYVTNKIGRNLIHHAALSDAYPIIPYLITQLQLDPNAIDCNGDTPLLLALREEDYDIRTIETLIRFGANPSIRNRLGQNAFDLTVFYPFVQERIKSLKMTPSPITL